MGLYERIVGKDDDGNIVSDRISPEVFTSVMSEFARDQLTGQRALAVLEELRAPLNSLEVDEAQSLLATVTGTPQQKVNRYLEIRDVLFLARLQAPGYSSPSLVRARLGV